MRERQSWPDSLKALSSYSSSCEDKQSFSTSLSEALTKGELLPNQDKVMIIFDELKRASSNPKDLFRATFRSSGLASCCIALLKSLGVDPEGIDEAFGAVTDAVKFLDYYIVKKMWRLIPALRSCLSEIKGGEVPRHL